MYMKKESKVWLISLEWCANTPMVSEFFPEYHVSVYEGVSESEAEKIQEDADKYSPYDYLDFEKFENESDFRDKLNYLISKGAKLI